jgi:hypothetical protein
MGSAGAAEPGRGQGDEGREDPRWADLPPVVVEIPDDARELDPDVRAYRRERRAALRHRMRPPDRAFVLGVGLVLLITMLAMTISPRRATAPVLLPLADESVTGPLLPAVTVDTGHGKQPLRDLRPGVIALVPAGCRCDDGLSQLVNEAAQYRLPVHLVDTDDRATPALRATAAGLGAVNPPDVLSDPAGAMVHAWPAPALTLLLVAADGRVLKAVQGPFTAPGLDLLLAPLIQPTLAPRAPSGAGGPVAGAGIPTR